MELRKRKSAFESEPELVPVKKVSVQNVNTPREIKSKKSDWKIESYLFDAGWKSLLDDEFQKEYFVAMNKMLEKGFRNKTFLPPESLVFNAFNSTKFEQV
jgi:hypothetical protein